LPGRRRHPPNSKPAETAPAASPSASDAKAPPAAVQRGGVTPRAIAIALLLTPANTYWIMQMELVRYSGHPTTISIFFNVVFCLLALTIVNVLVGRRWPKLALSQQELLVIYVMLSIASALCGHDFIEILSSYIGHAFWFATPENKWAELFHWAIPKWMAVRDREVLRGLYEGQSTLYSAKVLLAWATPVLVWTGFIVVLVLTMLCVNVLLRKRWIEGERLSYPLVQLPIEMTDQRLLIFKNRLLWIGFGLAGGIDLINGLNFWWPSIPAIPVRVRDLSPYITQSPWNAVGWFPISFYPFVLGLGMLLPVDLLFSCWFFFFFWKAQLVISRALSWDTTPNFPFINEQSFAGYIGLAIFALWTGRSYFVGVGRRILGKPDGEDDSREPWRYRTAAYGLLASFALLIIFCLVAGMSLWVAVAFFVAYLLISIAVTRIRAELGPPAHDLHNGGPEMLLVDAAGPRELGTRNLTIMSTFYFFNRAYRAHPMPFQLEGFKMCERAAVDARRLTFAMLLAAVAGCLGAFWAFLHIGYHLGVGSAKVAGPVIWAFGPEPWNRLQGWLQNPQKVNIPALTAMAVGLCFTLTLQALRTRFWWWPFHPVGYAVSSSWSLNVLWLPIMAAWIVKLLVLRYGGLRTYVQWLPFFYGLILGEFVVGSLWTIIGIVLNVPSYGFWV
jgi:hypothetical protein